MSFNWEIRSRNEEDALDTIFHIGTRLPQYEMVLDNPTEMAQIDPPDRGPSDEALFTAFSNYFRGMASEQPNNQNVYIFEELHSNFFIVKPCGDVSAELPLYERGPNTFHNSAPQNSENSTHRRNGSQSREGVNGDVHRSYRMTREEDDIPMLDLSPDQQFVLSSLLQHENEDNAQRRSRRNEENIVLPTFVDPRHGAIRDEEDSKFINFKELLD